MIYKDLHTSLLRFCRQYSEAQPNQEQSSFVNFDSSWQEADLPSGDSIGILGLTFEINDHIVEGSVQIGYSTSVDKNLFRLVDNVDKLVELLRPMNKLVIYDAESGVKKGLMVIRNGTRAMPVTGSKTRPVQFIALNFLTTTTYELPGEVS